MSAIARRLAKLEAAQPAMSGAPSGDGRSLAEACPGLLDGLDYHELQAWLFDALRIGSPSSPPAEALIPASKRHLYRVNPRTGAIEPIGQDGAS